VASDHTGATQAISFRNVLAGHLPLTFSDDRGGLEDLLPAAVPDVLVLSRLTSARGADLVDWARARNVPLVFHIDDDLLDVPAELGQEKSAHYRDPARLMHLRHNMDASDLVYASTGPLAERLRGHGITSPILPGRIYCSVDAGSIREPMPTSSPTIGYMGTGGHAGDLSLVLPVIEQLMDAMPSLRFELFGSIPTPDGLTRFGARVRHHPPVRDYDQFVARLRAMGWWIGIAPLEDHPFNRCKADTKWVEYSLAGMAVVASDLPVYHRACADGAGFLARTQDDWMRHLMRLLSEPALRSATIATAHRRLAADYAHAALRRQALEVFAAARQKRTEHDAGRSSLMNADAGPL